MVFLTMPPYQMLPNHFMTFTCIQWVMFECETSSWLPICAKPSRAVLWSAVGRSLAGFCQIQGTIDGVSDHTTLSDAQNKAKGRIDEVKILVFLARRFHLWHSQG
jgi:hypothetical protein